MVNSACQKEVKATKNCCNQGYKRSKIPNINKKKLP
jgi:hypothetical protein